MSDERGSRKTANSLLVSCCHDKALNRYISIVTDHNKRIKELLKLNERDILHAAGSEFLSNALGMSDLPEDAVVDEGKRALQAVPPHLPPDICKHPVISAFIGNPSTELATDCTSVICDILLHAMLPFPPVAISVAFVRFGLKRHCNSGIC